MTSIGYSVISDDLAHVVRRVENATLLGADFCDRLTRSLAQLFDIAAPNCSDDDRAAFDRILVRITPGATIEARIYLSDRLADSDLPPREILVALANDVAEVARPILVRSPALGECDLIDIARARGPGHMGAIAERVDLTIRVTDVLVLRGDDQVRRIVAGNETAPISDKSFTRLSLQARGDMVVEARLIRRGDLPDVVIRFLVENGSPEARRALAERPPAHRAPTFHDGTLLPIRAAEDGWLDAYDFEAATSILDRVDEVRNHVDGFIRRLAEADRFAEVVLVLAEVTGLPLETMKHLLVSLDTHPFAVVARALSLKSDTVRELLSTGPWIHRLDDRGRDAALMLFRSLDPEDSRMRLREWVEQETSSRH
ncbi:MAG: DUF2336 domain-containing protein [Siculibacillus sp.]|nr:DUF2336 domain-containing protein [Siculibacillus sp.]